MSALPAFAAIAVGDRLPPLANAAVNRVQLALYAGASGDHNPIHLDDERAKAVKLPGVIAHGMLTMAFLGQLVASWAPLTHIRSLGGRFAAMVRLGDVVTCTGIVAAKTAERGENRLTIDIVAETATGEKAVLGQAVIAVP